MRGVGARPRKSQRKHTHAHPPLGNRPFVLAAPGLTMSSVIPTSSESKGDSVSLEVMPLGELTDAVYIDGVTLTPAQKAAGHEVPSCISGSGFFCAMCWCCCCVGLFIPIAGLVVSTSKVIYRGDEYSTNTIILGVSLLLLGIGVCYFLFSARATVLAGGITKPKPPPFTGPWSDAANQGSGRKKEIKRLKVIVNPNAGVKKGASNLEICKKVWAARNIEVVVLETTHARHAMEIAQTVDLSDTDAICIIGGDGTFTERVKIDSDKRRSRPSTRGGRVCNSGNTVTCFESGSHGYKEDDRCCTAVDRTHARTQRFLSRAFPLLSPTHTHLQTPLSLPHSHLSQFPHFPPRRFHPRAYQWPDAAQRRGYNTHRNAAGR